MFKIASLLLLSLAFKPEQLKCELDYDDYYYYDEYGYYDEYQEEDDVGKCFGTDSTLSLLNKRTADGLKVDPKNWPFYANILQIRSEKYFHRKLVDCKFRSQNRRCDRICGAVIIDSQFVLTAAHCFQGATRSAFRRMRRDQEARIPKQYKFTVQAGFHLGQPEDYSVTDVIIHRGWLRTENVRLPGTENYCSIFGDDVAIMILDRPITWFTPTIVPCLATSFSTDKYTECRVAGKGKTSWSQSSINGDDQLLSSVSYRILPFSTCLDAFNKKQQILQPSLGSRVVCCKGKHELKGACQGDSGGPLFCREKTTQTWELVGLVSVGLSSDDCAGNRMPDAMTSIAAYSGWIQEVLLTFNSEEQVSSRLRYHIWPSDFNGQSYDKPSHCKWIQ